MAEPCSLWLEKGGKKVGAIAKTNILVLLGIAVVVIVILGIYSVNQTATTASGVSIQALSIDSSTSNLSATVNVHSPRTTLVRMNLFINSTFVGTWNYTTANASEGCCMRSVQTWSNGTYSIQVAATPSLMPMMSRAGGGCCMEGEVTRSL